MIKYEVILSIRLSCDVYICPIVKVHYVIYYVHVLWVLLLLLMVIVQCLLIHECLWEYVSSAHGAK